MIRVRALFGEGVQNRMAIRVEWADEDCTTLRMKYEGHWTIDELRRSGTDAIMMIRTVHHPVYVISDFTTSDSVPVGVLWQARDLHQMRPPNWEAGITVTSDGLAKSLLDLFGLVYMGQRRRRLYVAASNEEAQKIVDRLKSEKRVS